MALFVREFHLKAIVAEYLYYRTHLTLFEAKTLDWTQQRNGVK